MYIASNAKPVLRLIAPGIIIAGLCAALWAAPPPSRDTLHGPAGGSSGAMANRFQLVIDGLIYAGVRSVNGLDSESVVVPYLGTDNIIHSKPGGLKPGQITITKTWETSATNWLAWRQQIIRGTVNRKSVSIIFLSDSATELGRINLYNAWPSRWVGPSVDATNNDSPTEQLVLCYDAIEIK